MTQEEYGFQLIELVHETAAAVTRAGGDTDTCIVTPREMSAIVTALQSHAFCVRRCMDDGRDLRGVRVGATDVFARSNCPPGRLVVGGPELLK